MESEHKTSVYEYFTLTSVLKNCVRQCIISEDGGEKMCDEKISACSATTLKAHASTCTSNLKRHLGRLHPKYLKLMQKKDTALSGTSTASNTKS